MHFGKETIALILISVLILIFVGCGEDTIQEPPSAPKTASALLENVYPYGQEIFATYRSTGKIVNYTSNKLNQDLTGLPSLPEEGFAYRTWLYDTETEEMILACDNPFTQGGIKEYVDVDNFNLSKKYDTYRVTLANIDTVYAVDSIVFYETKLFDEIYDPVTDLLASNGSAVEMRLNADEAAMWADSAASFTDEADIEDIKEAVANVEGPLAQLEGNVQEIAQTDTMIMELPKYSSMPDDYIQNSEELSTTCHAIYGYIDDAMTTITEIDTTEQFDQIQTLVTELTDYTGMIAGQEGTAHAFEKTQELIRFYPSYFHPTPEGQVSVEGNEIAYTVTELQQLPEGWVYGLWLESESDSELIITFNTDDIGFHKGFAKLDSYPEQYDEINITIEPYRDSIEMPSGISVLIGSIEK